MQTVTHPAPLRPYLSGNWQSELVSLIENAKALGVSITTALYGETIIEVTVNGEPMQPAQAERELRTIIGNITEERR